MTDINKPNLTIAELIEEEMLSRLEWMTLQPNSILTAGASEKLQRKYSQAQLIAYDKLSDSQLPTAAITNAHAPQTLDMIFINLALSWCEDWPGLFKEWQRLLRPDGIIMITALGLNSGQELAELSHLIVPTRVDMHDLGDALLEAKYHGPVVDTDEWRFNYRDRKKCLREIVAMNLCHDEIATHALFDSGEAMQMTYEIIYAHAFAPVANPQQEHEDGSVSFPLSFLRQQLQLNKKG